MRVQVPVCSPPSPPPSLYPLLSFLSRLPALSTGAVPLRSSVLHPSALLFILPCSPSLLLCFYNFFFLNSSHSLRFKKPRVVLVAIHKTTFVRERIRSRMREVAPSAGESLTAGHPPPVPHLPLMQVHLYRRSRTMVNLNSFSRKCRTRSRATIVDAMKRHDRAAILLSLARQIRKMRRRR